jgi:uncharacterized membrane protein
MAEIWGTISDRWYAMLFALAYLILGLRILGGRRLVLFSIVAFAVAAVAENASVHTGIPYTRHAFNPALRGNEVWVFDVPLVVPMSYTFLQFLSFCAARAVAAGPWRRVPPSPLAAYALAVVFATWTTWTLDPVSQRGELWFLGELFQYEQPGFWFGLPLLSQVGWFFVSAALCALLARLVRHLPQRSERPLSNPLVWSAAVFLVQVLLLSVVALAVGEHTLGAAGLLMWVPVVAVTGTMWHQMRPQGAAVRSA